MKVFPAGSRHHDGGLVGSIVLLAGGRCRSQGGKVWGCLPDRECDSPSINGQFVLYGPLGVVVVQWHAGHTDGMALEIVAETPSDGNELMIV